jgi:hypothetical protein
LDQLNGFVGGRAPSMSTRPNHHVGKCDVLPKRLTKPFDPLVGATTTLHSFGYDRQKVVTNLSGLCHG